MALEGAAGMYHLHTRDPPILHRDLKSPNLLVADWVKVSVIFTWSHAAELSNCQHGCILSEQKRFAGECRGRSVQACLFRRACCLENEIADEENCIRRHLTVADASALEIRCK